MRGKKAKRIRREALGINCDEAELKYVERQIKRGRRYIEYFDAATYQQRYIDRGDSPVHVGSLPRHLKAVKLHA